ncbi:MAG: archaellin/type IV pilin N-terminal domain-containing protein [Methanomicrobiaceae archaeon]|nr:archaellin/type IV pilin N-terminal domain-containing protein [Methanomicrobiaceae archaeon]
MQKLNEDAFTGLEAAIVLIAFVVVAAVFSYVVLGAGFFTTQKTQETVYTGVEQASSSIEVLGHVYGLNETASTPEAIEFIQFTVGLTAGDTPMDFQAVTITWQTPTGITTIAKDSSVGASVTPVDTNLTAGNWGIMEMLNVDGTDPLLESNEQFTLLVALPSDNLLETNEEFTLEVRPSVGAVLPISREGPAKISKVNILL